MLGRKQEINLQFSQLLDVVLLLVAFVIAYQIRVISQVCGFSVMTRSRK